jgi:hypothetical protein
MEGQGQTRARDRSEYLADRTGPVARQVAFATLEFLPQAGDLLLELPGERIRLQLDQHLTQPGLGPGEPLDAIAARANGLDAAAMAAATSALEP